MHKGITVYAFDAPPVFETEPLEDYKCIDVMYGLALFGVLMSIPHRGGKDLGHSRVKGRGAYLLQLSTTCKPG